MSYLTGPGGLPLEQIDSTGAATYYYQDQLGSTRALYTQSGVRVATFTFDPYGTLAGSSGTATTPFGFAGQYTDAESGFQYLRARYYDPRTDQFLTVDPLAESTQQPYGYADENLLDWVDPAGLCTAGIHVGPINSGNVSLPFWGSGSCVHIRSTNPNYVTVQIGYNTGRGIGIQIGVTVTKDGRVYPDIGPSLGLPGVSGYAGSGYINAATTTCTQVDAFVNGWTLGGGGTAPLPTPVDPGLVVDRGDGPQLGLGWGSGKQSDFGYETILGKRASGISYTYSWNPYGIRLPVHWH